MSCGLYHTGLVNRQNELFIWGDNQYGQLGLSIQDKMVTKPFQVPIDEKVVSVACGYQNTLLLTNKQQVFVSGDNISKRIVEESDSKIIKFTKIQSLQNISRIFCTDFMMCITKDQSCYIWGGLKDNLGHGNMPQLIYQFQQKVLEANIGENFIVIVDSELMTYSCGANSFGQLGYAKSQFEKEFKCIEKINSHPIKKLACGKSFVLGLAGLITTDLSKSYYQNAQSIDNQSQYQQVQNYQHQNSQNVFQNQLEEIDSQEDSQDSNQKSRVSVAVQGFKNQVYDLLSNIKQKNPELGKDINPLLLKKLQAQEKELDDAIQNNLKKSIRKPNRQEMQQIIQQIQQLEQQFEEKYGKDSQRQKLLILLKRLEVFQKENWLI